MNIASSTVSDMNVSLAAFAQTMREQRHLTLEQVAELTGLPTCDIEAAETRPMYVPACHLSRLLELYIPLEDTIPPAIAELIGI